MSWNTSKIILTALLLVAPAGVYFYVDHAEKLSRSQYKIDLNNSSNLPAQDGETISLKSINPKKSGTSTLLVEQPATVEPYYRATLYSDVTGRIRFFEKDLGHKVKKNEVIAIVDPSKSSNSSTYNVTSPFDGVIAARTADPGDFVANAGVIPGAASLAIIERNDIVTITANLPDVLLTQVNKNTPIELIFDGLPNGKLVSTISRIAPSINIADRTIKVEVDIYNRTKTEYNNLILLEKKNSFQDFKGREQPLFPEGLPSNEQANLMPGNYGRIRVSAKPSEDVLLIPTSAIFRSGGISYVYKIENNHAIKKKIKVIVDDGNLVQATYLVKENGLEIPKPLVATDEIAISNQSDVDEDDKISSIHVTW
jgi:multidrug efflux pump subunit AcrA (membrane-fusion protein)